MTLTAHERIDLAYVAAPLLPEGDVGLTLRSVDPSGHVPQIYGLVVLSTATRVDDLWLERAWTLADLDHELTAHELAPRHDTGLLR